MNHGEYAYGTVTDRQTDGQTDGRQTVTLRFPLDAASIKNKSLIDCLTELLLSFKLSNNVRKTLAKAYIGVY